MEFIQCDQSEATHVKIVDDKFEDLVKKDKIYKYLYDADPKEETHYVVCEDDSLFYDFDIVVECEYLKAK